jgi:Sec-independent protein secretion pathway component TatC
MITRKSGYPVVAFAAAVVAAIVTPTPDAVNMLLWWLVLTVVFVVLFEVVRIVLPW